MEVLRLPLRRDSRRSYRQYLASCLAPVMLTNFLSNDAWQDYDDLASTLMMAVDAIIEAEQESAK
ncbi:hypothetical protein NZD08_002570 [Salmonella enterica]|nr:hypothetical protein [Salmonella enterica]EJP8910172.1 hypothetical protein [Salmonella enterica]ELB8340729.1 hypothetical protein [Salmonella enterica]ELO9903989.1 hypothetical protein [Salmonella enterica]